MSQPQAYFEQSIVGDGPIGRGLVISANAKVHHNKAGYTKKYFVPSIDILIGIGNDHTATLIMDVESHQAFQKGAILHIDLAKDAPKTVGEKRVRTCFNPTASDVMDEIKQTAAHLINLIDSVRNKTTDPELLRLIALGMTAAEEAGQWGVKAATYKPE